jgi:hypothetical protein
MEMLQMDFYLMCVGGENIPLLEREINLVK